MINIIIHRWKEIDIHIVFEALSEQLTIPYKYNRRTHTIEIREKVSHPIIIRGMYGSLQQMQGLYPDFYNCSSQEAETHLSERSTASIFSFFAKNTATLMKGE